MRAVLCRSLGDVAAIGVEEVASPPLTAGKVRIAVKAAGVNFPDILMIEGKYQVKPQLPFIPGLEVAGEVMECAAGVTHVRPGDRVLAFARSGGGYASEIVLPGAIVTPIPDSMGWIDAAAFPVAYGTVHFALDYRGRLQQGETLLVLGAAGGVGLAAIEVGKMMGARVIAAAGGPDKLAICKQHGADEVIDYTADRVLALTGGKGVDVVFDPVGGQAFEQCVRCIAWEGRILVIGFASGAIPKVATNMILVKNFSVVGVVFGAHSDRFPDDTRRRLGDLLQHYAAGRFKPRIHKVYPFEQAATALAEISNRRVVGKMVLTP
jgi:NADPH:quinone reductase